MMRLLPLRPSLDAQNQGPRPFLLSSRHLGTKTMVLRTTSLIF